MRNVSPVSSSFSVSWSHGGVGGGENMWAGTTRKLCSRRRSYDRLPDRPEETTTRLSGVHRGVDQQTDQRDGSGVVN